MASGQTQPGYVVTSGSKISPGGPTGAPGTGGGLGANAFNTTSTVFTVPPTGQTATVTLNDASWVVPGQYVWIDQAGGGGPGSAGELQVTAKTGNVITVLNPLSPAAPGLASVTGPGLVPTLPPVSGSGAQTTVWLRGDNTWQPSLPTGAVIDFAGATAPAGWLMCDGSSYATVTFPALFAAISYTFGGSGANFNVPDLRGQVSVGAGTGTYTGATNRVLAASGGEELHTLVTAEMVNHTHGVAHTHTLGNHTHTLGNHTHQTSIDHWHYCGGVDHLHSMQGHTHGVDHYHNYSGGGSHSHGLGGHTHGCAQPSSINYGTTSPGYAFYQAANSNTGGPSGGSDASGIGGGNVVYASQTSGGWANSGGPSAGTTAASDRSLAFNSNWLSSNQSGNGTYQPTSGGPSTNTSDGPSTNSSDGASIANTGATGGGGGHNNMPPFLVLNKIIKT